MNYADRQAVQTRLNIRFALANKLPEPLRIVRPNAVDRIEAERAERKMRAYQSCSQVYGQ